METKTKFILENYESTTHYVLLTPDQIRLLEWLDKNEFLYGDIKYKPIDVMFEEI